MNFSAEIYASTLRFYSDLLSGYRKYLIFIRDVPVFNAAGFLSHRFSRDPLSSDFYKKLIGSRAFDVYIEEELHPDIYHDVVAQADNTQKLQQILQQEFNKGEVKSIPKPEQSSSTQNISDTSEQLPFQYPFQGKESLCLPSVCVCCSFFYADIASIL